MSNAFSKEERVAFEDLLEEFEDELVLSKNVAFRHISYFAAHRRTRDQRVWRRWGNVETQLAAGPSRLGSNPPGTRTSDFDFCTLGGVLCE